MGDSGGGFSVLACSSNLRNVLLLVYVAFRLGLSVLQCGRLKRSVCELMGKSRVLRNCFCSERVYNDSFDWRKKDFAYGVSKELKNSSDANGGHCLEERDGVGGHDDFLGAKDEVEEEEEEEAVCNEDEVFSVTALRKMVKSQRLRANAAFRDLEKERMAAASAAEEAMAMILRHQNEKSLLQIQCNQLQRLEEEKHVHDQEVIQSLQLIVMQYEEERNLLEQELKLLKERLKMHVENDKRELLDCTLSLSHSLLPGCNLEGSKIGSDV